MNRFAKLVGGPLTLGRTPVFWSGAAMVAGAAAIFGATGTAYNVENASYFLVWTFMALGLGLVWGYGGILSFGQTTFFGLAGYCYAVITLNLGDGGVQTMGGLAGGVALAAAFAALLGWFMFYGGVKDVFVSIITLATTLVLETFLSQTAGPEWTIGKARLNGFNGMSGMAPLAVPWFWKDVVLEGRALFFALLILLILVYIGLRALVNSRFGLVLVAIRENQVRAEMLGYDVRAYQLGVFVIGAVLAALSGVFYVSWGQYITPESMGLTAAVLPVIWVAVGGRKDVTATLIGTVMILYLSQTLAIYGSQYALVVLGFVLLAAVMTAPEGFVVGFAHALGKLRKIGVSRLGAATNKLE